MTTTPVIGFAAFSGTGKTTLLKQLIPLLTGRGLRLGLIKHSHHHFEIDRTGKDSDRLRRAGAAQTLVISPRRSLMAEVRTPSERLTFEHLLNRVDSPELDLILVEGYKHQPIAKIELYRPVLAYPLLCREDPDVVAVATDAPIDPPPAVPILDLNDPAAIARFIVNRYRSDLKNLTGSVD